MDDATASGDDRNGTGRDGKEKKADAVAANKVSLLGMFRYADRLDVLLMVVGTVGAVANGMAEPLVTVLFGNVIDSFGESSAQSIARRVNKVSAPLPLTGHCPGGPASAPSSGSKRLHETPVLTVVLLPPGCSEFHIFGHRSFSCLLPS
jgi:hypothetical protein